jgi:P4 family phage/plasmid primase-like protien
MHSTAPNSEIQEINSASDSPNALTVVEASAADPAAIRAAAAALIAHGHAVCRVEPGEKRPVYPGWSTRTLQPDEFHATSGVGVVCGPLSAPPGYSLVCTDLDSAAVLTRADEFLPATDMIDGRPGKPRSHRWYFVRNDSIPTWAHSPAPQASAAAREKCGHPGPWKKGFNGPDGKRAIDFIGTGGQCVVPPSIHVSGETRQWEGDAPGEPARVEFMTLWQAVCDLANATGCHVPTARAGKKQDGADNEADGAEADGADEPTATAADGQLENPFAIDHPGAEKFAAGYLSTMPLPRTGQGGDANTYRTLGVLLFGFAMCRAKALAVFEREVNAKLRAMGDAWERGEIERKLDILILRGPDEANYGPVGCKLPCAAGGAPAAWNDPNRLAGSFTKDRPGVAIKDTVALYDGGRYVVASDEWMNREVREHVQAARDREYRRRGERLTKLDAILNAPDPADTAPAAEVAAQKKVKAEAATERVKLERLKLESVGKALVAEVSAAVRAKWQRPDDTGGNSWLRGGGSGRYLSVANGLLNLDTFELTPHTPDYYTLTRIAAPFDPAAPAPEKFLAVLGELLEGDAERIARVQEMFGACLDPFGSYKFFGCFVGPRDCGKSVLGTVMRAVLGAENIAAVDLGQLAGSQFGTWPLYGKLLNFIGDQSAIDLDNVGLLKTFTGGDVVKFEQKGKDPIFGVCTAKLIYVCNELPALKDRTDATWRRQEIVVFQRSVPREQQDNSLQDVATWTGELPGILKWALDGLKRLRANRGQFTRSAVCEAQKEDNRLASDPTRAFLLEHYEAGGDADTVPAAQLYRQYEAWCGQNGYRHALAGIPFGRVVGRTFPKAQSAPAWQGEGDDRVKVRCWHGLRVREGVSKALGVPKPTFQERMERMGTDKAGASVPAKTTAQ